MKALTICQPYPHLIALGEKRVENRTWYTRHRGELAIHAGKSRSWLADDIADKYQEMVFGAVIAIAQLVDCVEYGPKAFARYPWLESHVHAGGPFCWILDDVQPIVPVYCNGHQGLWNFDPPASALKG
ncbi:MAG TPA: ASCH domain-containing protein [Gammaproteobacteria bacterium]|nr:ASCH domain-containing protein [Gammaproteobacteria bacterium]